MIFFRYFLSDILNRRTFFNLNFFVKIEGVSNLSKLHIWKLYANQIIASVTIEFKNIQMYVNNVEKVKKTFNAHGVTDITIQPEFACLV